MFEILIFGDSLTRGADPGQHRRHPFADRWPNVLSAGLAGRASVAAEGLGGRTTIYDDESDQRIDRNGSRTLPTLLASHPPLDLLIIMLGSNDLKPEMCGTADGVATGMEKLLDIVEAAQPRLKTLIVSPPIFVGSEQHGGNPRAGRSIEESRRLGPLLEQLAIRRKSAFFDASTVAKSSLIDGVHLDRENTRAIGLALVPIVEAILDCLN
ncbi:SGNH/GDSL hydrolase family protein [Rhizobium leguminosarum]|uniref:SGNH/GDSL hydrolase family protein n=1 Tax=Rhizobium leguminosarum TaxID=384 RepID=UPI001442671C|nr:SGNH/GDSL hydrolase family protein [Rhizobium leguminosarum]NKL67482.1 arylesterase [Rhizobium leguminosarum bv. viciae]